MATEQPSTETDWDDVSFIVSSNLRTSVFLRLVESPAIPSAIAADTDIAMQHVSRSLTALREEDLVQLLVDEDRKKGRIYGLTDHGSSMAGDVEEVA